MGLSNEGDDLSGNVPGQLPRKLAGRINEIFQRTIGAMVHDLDDGHVLPVLLHLPLRVVRIGLVVDNDAVNIDDIRETLEL